MELRHSQLLLVGLMAAYLAIAAYVLIDDARCRRRALERASHQVDQLIADAEENAAARRASPQSEET
jgi:hypothetical protein